MYVLDASVVLKWFLEEENSDKALWFKDRYLLGICNIAFPDLMIYEISNSLKFNKKFDSSSAYEAIDALINLRIDIIVPTKSIIKQALNLAVDSGVTFYDAIYVALADHLKYDFITADEKLARKLPNLKFIKLLKDF